LSHPHLLTDGGVTQRPRTDLTGDHLTGVQANPQPQCDTVAAFDVDGQVDCFLLYVQSRHASAKCVVLQRYRGAKNRHNPIAGELVHRAGVAMHNRGGAIDQFGHDLAQPLRTHRCGDVHRMHDIGKQHSDLLVFGRCGGRDNWRSTLVAELGARPQFSSA
jgi:hypothetical protein